MADDDDDERDEGAEDGLEEPIMPEVPAELGIDPMLLAVLHCAAFLDLANDQEVDPDAAGAVLENLEVYVKRLPPERLAEIQRQLEKLEAWAEEAGWPEELVDFVADFLYSCGVGEDDAESPGDPG
jgi:hypothetical protein